MVGADESTYFHRVINYGKDKHNSGSILQDHFVMS